MTPADAIPGAASAGTGAEPLWTPGPERIAATQIDAFRRAVGVDGGYRELHRWSVDHPVDFWQAVWNHLGVVGDPGSTVVDRDGASHLTGTRWFPDGCLNFAETLLGAADARPALLLQNIWGALK